MPHSDDFGIDDDDTVFLAAATQAEASQYGGGFAASPRPTKRRRIRKGLRGLDGAESDDLEWSDTDIEAHSPPKNAQSPSNTITTQASAYGDDADGSDEEYYFPDETGEAEDLGVQKVSKYKIHIPKNGGQFKDVILTQTQAGIDSSPGRIRGPVWKKPKPVPPPVLSERTDAVINQASSRVVAGSSRQTSANGFARAGPAAVRECGSNEDALLAARLQAEEDALAKQRSNAGTQTATQVHDELVDIPSDAFSSSSPEKPGKPPLRAPQTGLKQLNLWGGATTQDISASQMAKKRHAWPLKEREEPPTHHKLDEEGMKTWVYPTNLGKIRDYQYNIVSRSLYHNTLVALPTGLGKTFIAATVMLNYYRWTMDAQMVFMAPTKPLIAQQMDACYNVVGIPRRDTVLMTGETTPAIRGEEWLEKRVFFMTPQTVINDLKTGICDPKRIVLIVVDEAHKATGSYAYTEVIAFMRRFNSSFRVLALTATPGSTVDAVQAVIDHLGIARVELRTELSLDIRPYTHEKEIAKEVFDYSDEQHLIMDHISKALKSPLEKLNAQNAYWSKDPMMLTAFGLTQARQKWSASDAGRKAPMWAKGQVNACFTVLSQAAHQIGLLKNHGIGPFYTGMLAFQRSVDNGDTKGKNAKQVVEHEDFSKMMSRIRSWTNNPDFIGHPKLQYLREVVLNHFLDAAEGAKGPDVPPSATRVMVFASYRDSTDEIVRVLKRNEPLIRPHVFVGQAASSSGEGMNQKKQNEVIQDFKTGKFNTLVATSIGEEGLDIGDVDLIVCYDASSSPIRMLQRIGRTGRKRVGKVVLLLMRGKEENDYAKAQDNYAYIQKTIADDSKYSYREDQSPRILPKEVRPVVDRRVIEIPVENSQPIDLDEKGRRAKGKAKKRPPKKFHMPDGVRTGFTKASKLGGSDDEHADDDEAKARTVPRAKKAPCKPQPVPEPEPMAMPYLQDVLLNPAQQAELERKYAHVADDDDVVIQAPDAASHPATLRYLGPTKYIRHGRTSQVVSNAIRALRSIDENKLQRLESAPEPKLLRDTGPAGIRLASPEPENCGSAADLPAMPLPADKPKKPHGRPRKKNVIVRGPSHGDGYGDAAMEGDESEPEPTPADMRIGTQGIDLGSHDTSGEDEEEAPDSELAAFIAMSDEVVEAEASSVLGSVSSPAKGRLSRRKLGQGVGGSARVFVESDQDNAEASAVESDDSDATVRGEPRKANRKKKRIIVDSDSE
ncbi:P-loop containing nucleoside triphosphate hydrolase protein [Teratosphaeria nubilosa]|uniref:ATP-dependent DNA helicase n=1 Tax=Teratosphaeria nubilosa TaxID=161662 RepID=A0A6G1LGC9_9PEZI|nr:P-loop containing nucleoside triphosphate hydrolase protein [Teratosphaeria nubilosa]